MREDRITQVLYDLETTGLFGSNGDILLSCTFLDITDRDNWETYNVAHFEAPEPDDIIAEDIRDELSKYDRIIAWNSHGFDLKFLNDRLKAHHKRPLVHRGSFDMKEYAKATYPYMGGTQAEWLQAIDAEHQKTPLDIEQNMRLGRGEGSAEDWRDLMYHNDEDVKGMKELYDFFFPRS